MGVIRKIKCDNPSCKEAESAEWWASRGNGHQPPYGWLKMEGYFQGIGPSVTVEVCSTACLEAAVDAAVAESRDQ